jgi:hypothetical protein
MPFNLATAPVHHKTLLEVIATLDAALNAIPNTHFYVTGGAAAAYILPEKAYSIKDIDCVCVTNPALEETAFKEARNTAIRTTKEIIKELLESIAPAAKEALVAELPAGTALQTTGFQITSGNTNGYVRPAGNTVTIPEGSPFTGIEYHNTSNETRVISVQHRFYPFQSLLEITFPTRNYSRIKDKWNERFNKIHVMDVLIPVIIIYDLQKNQNYAAKHNTRAAKVRNRTQRAANLSEEIKKKISRLPVITATVVKGSPPLPPPSVTRRSAPAPPPVGGGSVSFPAPAPAPIPVTGGGSVSFPSPAPVPVAGGSIYRTPPPFVVIRPIETHLGTSAILIEDGHEIRARSYDQAENTYGFSYGERPPFIARIGDEFWRYPDGRLYPYPPLSAQPGFAPWFTISRNGTKYFHTGRGDIVPAISSNVNRTSGNPRFHYPGGTYGSPGHYYQSLSVNPRTGKPEIRRIPF